MVLSCFNIKFDDKGRFDLLSFATLILKAEIYSVYSPVLRNNISSVRNWDFFPTGPGGSRP